MAFPYTSVKGGGKILRQSDLLDFYSHPKLQVLRGGIRLQTKSSLVHSSGSKNQKSQKGLAEKVKKSQKKNQQNIYLIIKVIFLEQSVSTGLLFLDNKVNCLLNLPEVYTPHLEYFKEGLFIGRSLPATYFFSPTWVWQKLCKVFGIKAKALHVILFLYSRCFKD